MVWTGSNQQRLALKSFIQGTPALATLFSAGDYQGLVDALNAQATPAYWVWRTSVTEEEFQSKVSSESTLWSWSVFIARSIQELMAWERLFNKGQVNPSLPNIPPAINDIFSGTEQSKPGAPAQRDHCRYVMRRRVTLAERQLVIPAGDPIPGGTAGNGTKNTPGTMGLELTLEASDINAIME